jgi:integrase
MRKSFSLYKKSTKSSGTVWYARFWNAKVGKYTEARSTGIEVAGKKGRRQEAWNQAMLLLPTIVFDEHRVENANPVGEQLFLEYIATFWADDGAYAKDYALTHDEPLSAQYLRGNRDDIRLHIKPYKPFAQITVKQLSAGMIRSWRRWASENDRSPRRINAALSAMRVAIRHAIANEDLEKDPFNHLGKAKENPKEKGILTPAEVQKLFNAPVTNIQDRAVVLLGTLCGMRRGEMRGLFWGDIKDATIDLNHNFVNFDGLKHPKRGSKRTIPLLEPVAEALEQLKNCSPNPAQNSYVFESLARQGKPLGETFFRNAFSR